MRIVNWIKKNWTDPVWSKVFAGIILAIISGTATGIYKVLKYLLTSQPFRDMIGGLSKWLSLNSEVPNSVLLLLLLFFGVVSTLEIYQLLIRNWLGRKGIYYASSKNYTVRGTFSLNLDLGVQAKGLVDCDFWWQQKDKIRRSIVPKNGAEFCIIGQKQPMPVSKSDLEKLNYSDTEIIADNSQANQIPTGMILGYITKEGRFGYMKILSYGYDLEIEFYTYIQ